MPEEPTTPDPVELTHRALAAANRSDIDAVIGFFAPDAVLDGRAAGDHYEGRTAIRGSLDDWFGSFAELRMEAGEFVALDGRVVLTLVTQVGRPAGVDGQVRQREGWAFYWSADGLIERLTMHADIGEARAAAERLAEKRG